MNPADTIFTVMTCCAFLAAILDHWYYGQGILNKPVRAFLLGCFLYTEIFLAITAQPAMWLYSILNVWGLYNLFKGVRREKQRRE